MRVTVTESRTSASREGENGNRTEMGEISVMVAVDRVMVENETKTDFDWVAKSI